MLSLSWCWVRDTEVLRVELRGGVLISGFWEPALRNVKKMKCKMLLLLEMGDEEVTRPQPGRRTGWTISWRVSLERRHYFQFGVCRSVGRH